MARIARPGYERFDLVLPADLMAALAKAAESQHLSLTNWACKSLASAAGVEYTARERGRPKNPEEAASKAAPGKRRRAKA
jgi:hypothetical protein